MTDKDMQKWHEDMQKWHEDLVKELDGFSFVLECVSNWFSNQSSDLMRIRTQLENLADYWRGAHDK